MAEKIIRFWQNGRLRRTIWNLFWLIEAIVIGYLIGSWVVRLL